MAEFFEVIHDEPGIANWDDRLRDCLSVWGDIVEEHAAEGWSKNNPDAIMELYPIPALEERMQREGKAWKDKGKEKERKDRLREHGLLQE
jgi:hypothetical protein